MGHVLLLRLLPAHEDTRTGWRDRPGETWGVQEGRMKYKLTSRGWRTEERHRHLYPTVRSSGSELLSFKRYFVPSRKVSESDRATLPNTPLRRPCQRGGSRRGSATGCQPACQGSREHLLGEETNRQTNRERGESRGVGRGLGAYRKLQTIIA